MGRPDARRKRLVAWSVAAASVFVVALATTATVTLVRSNDTGIPTVTDITAVTTDDAVEFDWVDPGLLPSDTYLITASDLEPSIQSRPGFTVAAHAGDRVCLVVTVNRDGTTGHESSEKCVDFSS